MILIKKDLDLIRDVVRDALETQDKKYKQMLSDALEKLDRNSIAPIRAELKEINAKLSTKASKADLDELKSRVESYHPIN